MSNVIGLYTDHHYLKLYEAAYNYRIHGLTLGGVIDNTGRTWTEQELLNILIEKGYKYVGTK